MILAFVFFNHFFRSAGFLFVIKACNISDYDFPSLSPAIYFYFIFSSADDIGILFNHFFRSVGFLFVIKACNISDI